ncbi:uracil-DNA glycosylase family protein [Acidovorax sp. A1169]|uniref:uracil-DNA glycosylase family protein n=1 Tax=Acidovorax sp. A1169 TaxID=3059524 RepID=UPI00273800BD|nr:uracil-DNA glycosylase family protein [Acidovorax sp. A1169]MDP4075865.1 uracil-DNA glycosylase family protein [Acidovorax sp. A1169]
MSLSLDARQRAMLQEMGVTVWAPGEATAAPPAAALVAAPADRAVPVHDGAVATAVRPTPQPPAPAAPLPAQANAPAPAPAALRKAAATPPVAPAAAAAATGLSLHAPQALYPTADPARTPAGLGSGWLIVAEIPHPAEPLSGDAGKLLDNMLRAMQLHHHPRVFLAALQRAAPGGQDGSGNDADVAGQLAEAVATLQPAMVLVLGHVAARAALASTEPLGRMRAGPHTLAGCPAVVTYDPAFLLRSQDNKAAAWADLCRALATVRAAANS